MYNYPYYWQNMQQCNFSSSQFYSYQSMNTLSLYQQLNDASHQFNFKMMQQSIMANQGDEKSCKTCKYYFNNMCNLHEQMWSMGIRFWGFCTNQSYWELKPSERKCSNCEYGDGESCDHDRMCAENGFGTSACCVGKKYWRAKRNNPVQRAKIDVNVKYSDSCTSIAAELSQRKTNEENLEVARKHGLAIDLTKQENQPEKDLQTKIRIEELKRRIEQLEAQQLQTNFFKPFQPKEDTVSCGKSTTFIDLGSGLDNVPLKNLGIRKVKETEHERTIIIEDKTEKKYTVYDLYELVFPDDPIKAHFDAERKRIEEKYKPQEEVVEKISVPDLPKRHPEPIQTETYDDDMMTVLQAAAFWIGAIAAAVILILT